MAVVNSVVVIGAAIVAVVVVAKVIGVVVAVVVVEGVVCVVEKAIILKVVLWGVSFGKVGVVMVSVAVVVKGAVVIV